MAGQADIRKWFMKPTAKASAAESTPTKAEESKGGERSNMEKTPVYKTTSKFFASTPPGMSTNTQNDELKTPVIKASPAAGKRLKEEKESDDEEKERPSLKKPRSVEQKGVKDESESDSMAPSSVTPKGGGKGRGRGKRRGGSNAKATEDEDEDVDDPSVKASGGGGRGGGRGRGRGRGKSDLSAVSTSDVDDPEPSPKKPVAGRGRGRGRGDSSTASQADTKPAAAAGRGRGGGGGWGGGGGFGAREAPPHKGEKEIPQGAADALAGLTFVISGTLDSLEREEAEDLIKSHGGRITGSVSKKTDYLLADEDIGGRKSQKAKEIGVKFLTEDGLLDMICKTKPKPSSVTPQPLAKKAPVGGSGTDMVKPPVIDMGSKGKQKIENGSTSTLKGKSQATNTESWPHKHRPKTTDDIIGNQSIVKQIRDWLLQWEAHHGVSVNKGKKGSKSNSSAVKKAVLLSGQPGIGKTTTARLLCEELGFESLEVNASDSRGKADSNIKNGMKGSTSNTIKEMVSNESLSFGSGIGIGSVRRPVLIMDEVDGMSGGDRGGVADLIASIKASRIPIICICNDKYSQKLKSLINYCLPLAYRKPTKQQMAKRLQQIAKSEGLQVDDIALEELSERVNGDMRMALNQLQYMSLRSQVLNYADIRTRLMASAKDEDVTPFSAVDKLLGFNGGRLRMDERMDAAMSDMDLVPLLIEENYLNYCPSGAGRDENGTARMDLIARTALSIAEGDIVNVQIRRYRQWQHAQMGAFMSSIIPAALIHGRREVLVQGERNFNRFGGWLGKNSAYGKRLRLLEDIHVHLLASRVCEPTREAVRLDYLPLLARQLTQPLHTLPKEEAVQQVVDVMDEYSLNQEDVDTIHEISKFKGGEGLLEGVPAAVKTALTKAFKQREGRVRSSDLLPVLNLPGFKKVTKKPARMNFMAAEDEEDLASLQDPEAEDEEESPEEGEEEDEENKLALLSESKPGITVTLDTSKSKAGAGRGRGRGSSQPKTPRAVKKPDEAKATSSAKRKR